MHFLFSIPLELFNQNRNNRQTESEIANVLINLRHLQEKLHDGLLNRTELQRKISVEKGKN